MGGSQFHLAEKQSRRPEKVSLVWETHSVLDVANFRNNDPVVIPIDRKTERLAVRRPRLFGKHRRCGMSLIWGVTIRPHVHVAGKRNRWPGNDLAIRLTHWGIHAPGAILAAPDSAPTTRTGFRRYIRIPRPIALTSRRLFADRTVSPKRRPVAVSQ